MDLQCQDNPRKRAVGVIKEIEMRGGFVLKCGCIIACRASEIRRLLAISSPEAIIEIAIEIQNSDHPKQECKHATDI